MAKEFAKAFYKSRAWQQCRQAYIVHVHGLCERCQEPGLILHHKIYLTPENINDPNITLSFENLEYLCLDCHNREHSNKNKTRQRYKFAESGDIIPV